VIDPEDSTTPAIRREPHSAGADNSSEIGDSSRSSDQVHNSPRDLRSRQRATLDANRPRALASSIAARKGRALTRDHKDKLSDVHKKANAEHPRPRKVPLWMIAEDALLGLTSVASAKKLEKLYGKPGGHQADVWRQRSAMGLVGWPAAYRHGEALGWKHFGDFCSDFGHTKKEWAPLIQISYQSFTNRVKRKGDRPFSSPRPEDSTVPHPGHILNKKWDELIEQFCYTEGKRWVVRDFLTSEVRDFQPKHMNLTAAFTLLGFALQSEGGRVLPDVRISRDVDSISEWICAKARNDSRMQLLVRFLLPLRALLRSKPKLLAAGTYRSETLASELMAQDYKGTAGRIEEAILGYIHPLHPNSLRKLASAQSLERATAVSKKKPGARTKSNKKFKIIGEMYESSLPRMERGYRQLEKARKDSPANSQHWSSTLREDGFTEPEIAALLTARNASGAVTHWLKGIPSLKKPSLKTIKNSLTLYRKSLESPEK
jgi:hypothetical protein